MGAARKARTCRHYIISWRESVNKNQNPVKSPFSGWNRGGKNGPNYRVKSTFWHMEAVMKKTLFFTLAAMVIAGCLSAGLAIAWEQRNSAQLPAQEQAKQVPVGEYEYILREHEGRLAVFLKDKDTPEMVFDVYVRLLPEYDRGQLNQGVYVKDYEELIDLSGQHPPGRPGPALALGLGHCGRPDEGGACPGPLPRLLGPGTV